MQKDKLVQLLNAELLVPGNPAAAVSGGYCGDFLSFVMGKAPADAVWFTVMSNVNVAAVALLAEVGAVVVCEGVTPEPALVARCEKEGITLLKTAADIYSAAVIYARED